MNPLNVAFMMSPTASLGGMSVTNAALDPSASPFFADATPIARIPEQQAVAFFEDFVPTSKERAKTLDDIGSEKTKTVEFMDTEDTRKPLGLQSCPVIGWARQMGA
jgi:hypothetical protein